ncbi:MAG: radical SAM family heme chaperone HemW [Opitutales bacterium]|nr:radical SAM family heme chaperone HemW [Opitutales bacterium]
MSGQSEFACELGLYVHVPFCARRCEFCAFYEREPRRADIARYMDGVLRELHSLRQHRRVKTVFWGGGTPGILLPADMERLGSAVLDVCGGMPQEWTVEMTPLSMRPERLRTLKAMGVNRISMGVQSFDSRILEALGRMHSREQVYGAIKAARDAGFDNLNIDMMFALPGQSFEQWEADLNEAIEARPEHISTYCLTFEEDTPLWHRLTSGQTQKRSDEDEALFYEKTWEILDKAGLWQYEVANFARPGRECLHNLNTWRMHEWLGAGPSASSQFGMKRWTNTPSLDAWLEGVNCGVPARVDEVDLDDEMLATDALVFGLRMIQGVDMPELRTRFPKHDWDAFDALTVGLCAEGLAQREEPFLKLTPKGRLLTDQIGLSIMELGS